MEHLTEYQRMELEPSWNTQLDIVGMQPHSREYLENKVNHLRSECVYETIDGQMIDFVPGIHFGDTP